MPMLLFFLSNLNFDCCLINEKLFLGASGGNKMEKKNKSCRSFEYSNKQNAKYTALIGCHTRCNYKTVIACS